MFRHLSLVFCFMFVAVAVYAQDTEKEEDRLETSAVVMEEIMNVPDTIPQELLEKAECVVVIPSVTKIAVGFGGSYGRGAMVCRSGKNFNGPWGAPAMYALEGGSFGLQLGGQSSDLVLLVMNEKGAGSNWAGRSPPWQAPKAVTRKQQPMRI